MLSLIVGFIYWMGDREQLNVYQSSPKIAFTILIAFFVEISIYIMMAIRSEDRAALEKAEKARGDRDE